MAAPREDGYFHNIVCCTLLLCMFYKSLGSDSEVEDDFLLCRQCGHEVMKAVDLNNVGSPLAMRQRNDTILGQKGVLIQLFKNPHERHFEVITSINADVHLQIAAYSDHSWFPGFSWRVCTCPRCGHHLGWFFENIDKSLSDGEGKKSFFGIILDHLLHKDYADSLLIVPKAYNS